MTNLSIGRRILLGFALVLALTTAMGLRGIDSAGRLAGLTQSFHDRPFVLAQSVNDAQLAFLRLRLDARDLVLAETADQAARTRSDVEANSAAFLEAMDKARGSFGGDKEVFDRSLAVFREYRAMIEQVAQLARDGDRSTAMALLAGKGHDLADRGALLNATIDRAADEEAEAFMVVARDTRASVRWELMALLGCAVAAGAVVATLVGRSISRPLGEMTAAMTAMARADMTVEVPGTSRGDEVGVMASALKVFKDGLLERGRLEADARAAQDQELARAQRRDQLARQFEGLMVRMLEKVGGTVSHVRECSAGLNAAASQTSAHSGAVTRAAEQTAANVQTVAAATEQLGASTSEITRRVHTSAQVSRTAVAGIGEINDTMGALGQTVERIGRVVELISAIAGQTNMLALNATIEAARAGDAGKGFHVVAGEVKNLANQTARATGDIGRQIEEVQEAARAVLSVVARVGGTIAQVDDEVASIAAAVEQQSAATREIAANAGEVAVGNDGVTRNICDVARAAEHTDAMAGEMFSVANELQGEAETLRREVEHFLDEMRAA